MSAQILVADDDSGVIALLKEYLEGKNYRVITVVDGFQLSQEAVAHQPDLIISDISMPWADGSSVYQVLQKDSNSARIPVIFISGHPFEKLKDILPVDPKTRFIQKPVSFAALDKFIAELLPMGGYIP